MSYQGLLLDGNGYASISDASQAGLDMGLSDFMIEGLYKPRILDSDINYDEVIFSKRESGNDRYYFRFRKSTLFQFYGVVTSAVYTNSATLSPVMSKGRWNYFALVFDRSADVIYVYINGTLAGTTGALGATGIVFTNAGLVEIGAHNGINLLDGLFDEHRIWNFGLNGLPADYAAYITWRSQGRNRFLPLSDYAGGAWVPYADADRTEKVVDGGLENWTGDLLDDWSEYRLSGGVRDLFDENGTGGGNKHGGSHAAKLEATLNDGTTDFYLQQIISLTANKYYSFKGWYYFFARTVGECRAYLQEMDGYTTLSMPLDTSSLVGDYTYFEGVFQAADANHCIILMSRNETTGIVYFDDISVKRVGLVGHWKFDGNLVDEIGQNDLTEGGTGNLFPTYSLKREKIILAGAVNPAMGDRR